MEYRCISADCHIDLGFLPDDLFTKNASQAMKARMPHVIGSKDGPMWVGEHEDFFGFVGGLGGAGRKHIPGQEHRMDRMAETGLFEDVEKRNIRRPGDPKYRLQDQDRDGIQAEVMYGILGVGAKVKDPQVASEVFRIYNDWLADFCSYDRKRFVGLAYIPCHNVVVAVAEVNRVASLGLGGIDFAFNWDMIPLWHRYWEPLWKAAADNNLAVHFHTIGIRKDPPRVEMTEMDKLLENATRISSFQLVMGSILSAVIHCGALERYPQLRIVLGESGIGWIPYVLERMDEEWEGRYRERLSMKMKPSEYWRRQCRATFQNDRVGSKLLDELGEDCVMWGSDYPHADGVFPDSQDYIKRQFSHLPAPTQHKIICENVGRFYGLIS